MIQGDYALRHRIERFSAFYRERGQLFDLIPTFVDVGFPTSGAVAPRVAQTRVCEPAKDFPFLWLGISMRNSAGVQPFLPQSSDLLRFTVLKNSVNLGNAASRNLSFNNAVPLQPFVGYGGKPAMFAYPYLFEAHDQLQVEEFAESAAETFDQITLIGFKVIARG